MVRSLPAATILAAALLSPAHPLAAGPQDARPESTPPDLTLADLARVVQQQGRLLEEQGKEIQALRAQLETTRALGASNPDHVQPIEQKPPATGPAAEARIAQAEPSDQKVPVVPSDMVSTGEFPGSFRVPGTDAALRISGLVRMTDVNTFGPLGTEDRFVTSSIPVSGTPEAGKEPRTTFTANPSRFSFDLRTPTGIGAMRAFIEGDFGGSSRTLRLRHAYGQWGPWVIGQTWSTFSDPEAEPDGIDFEGLNAISLFRQPQIRFTHRFQDRLRLALALENPSPDITGTSGVSQAPDVIVRIRWAPGQFMAPLGFLHRQGSHLQAALLFRQIRGQSPADPNVTLSTVGFGGHVSGRLSVPGRSDRSQVMFALYAGQGIGRYITDLGTLGGQDAVYDPATQALDTLPVFAAYAGVERRWSSTLRSTVTYGYVRVDNLAIQPLDALRSTNRGSLNLSWSPISRVDLVAEYLLGNRTNKDGNHGFSNQLQLGGNFRF
jgi:hypothetical protein